MTEKQFAQAPSRLTVRELQVGGKTLVTTLLCAKLIPKGELKSLYRQRWHVELDFRHLKATMGMEMLASKSPAMAIKEIWIHLLAYNLIRRMMMQAANIEGVLPRQLSFKHALQLCMASRHYFAHLEGAAWDLLRFIAKRRVGQRPGRIEPRVIKRRPQTLSTFNRTPRPRARKTAASWTSMMLKSVPFVPDTSLTHKRHALSRPSRSRSRCRAQQARRSTLRLSAYLGMKGQWLYLAGECRPFPAIEPTA